ncbi:ClpP/crotonase [Cantharellus anzutake]|uniref:ClpP/crotonase n=1 Tax=Cantharellus anzutake TaxID=1750568 RepID=UPI0019085AD0|nr:ClpP/crotonase [Cantharellus anzutake]KAF8327918.1 ClpP/crotonase [Cantharellus anzutake]
MTSSAPVLVHFDGPIATITLDRPEKLNTLNSPAYDALADALVAANEHADTVVTLLQAHGRYFSAGTWVDGSSEAKKNQQQGTKSFRRQQVALNSQVTDISRLLYVHRKILVAVLNGPVMGVVAGFLGHFDFIYSAPGAWLAVPFTALGLVPEVGTSVTFPRRMGFAKATEALVWGKKQSAEDLLAVGFVNKIFPPSAGLPKSATLAERTLDLHRQVREYLLDLLDPLDPRGVVETKQLIKDATNEQNNPDAANLRESSKTAELFVMGVPPKRFAEFARRERRHRL